MLEIGNPLGDANGTSEQHDGGTFHRHLNTAEDQRTARSQGEVIGDSDENDDIHDDNEIYGEEYVNVYDGAVQVRLGFY